jgi:serine protease Do
MRFFPIILSSAVWSCGTSPSPAADAASSPPRGVEVLRQLNLASRQAAQRAVAASCRVGSGGSGTIITPDGYIVTNNHVVGNNKTVDVYVYSEKRTYKGRVVSNCPRDIAFVKIDVKNFPCAPLGDSDAVEIGDMVLSVGMPYFLTATVTDGIVAFKTRVGWKKFISSNTAQNPGNSGGGLFNMLGELIGVNGTIQNSFVCNGTPSNYIKLLLESARAGRTGSALSRGLIGVNTENLSEKLAAANKLPSPLGVVVTAVTEGGPAHKAGIQKGDIITHYNNMIADDAEFFGGLVSYTCPSLTVPVQIVRDGRRMTLQVRVAESPPKQ